MKERLEHLIRYYWLHYLTAAVLSVIFVLLLYTFTEPKIPNEKQLRIKIGVDITSPYRFVEWQPELEKQLELDKVSFDVQLINRYNANDKSWELFNSYIYMADFADVFVIPANKAESLAGFNVLLPLDEYKDAVNTGIDEKYYYPGKDGKKALYALPAEKAEILNTRFGIDISGDQELAEYDGELVFCIPAYSKNIKGAIDWINLLCNLEY